MSVSKVFLGPKLIRLGDGSQPKLQGDDFDLLLEEFSLLSSLNIQNQANNLKLGNGAKMGPTSGVDIVKCMHPTRDLEGAWLMFDHYKCLQH